MEYMTELNSANDIPSGSIEYNHISKHICYDQRISELAIAVNALRNEIKELMISRLTIEENLPNEIVIPAIEKHFKEKYKLGRPPMESEIRDAISKTKDMQHAAEYLGISVFTLKRYCIYFSEAGGGPPLWQPRRGSKAIKPLSVTEEQSIRETANVKPSPFGTGSFFNL